jgi:hypothetical protein
MDPQLGKKVCYVQFPQRFDGIDRNDRYANHNTVFFDVSNRRIPSYCLYLGTLFALQSFTEMKCMLITTIAF